LSAHFRLPLAPGRSSTNDRAANNNDVIGLRFTMLAMVLFGGYAIGSAVWNMRADYWLRTDAAPVTAHIKGKSWDGHGQVDYWYEVAGVRHEGKSHPTRADPQHATLKAGDEAPGCYSRSHPWVSSLAVPGTLWPPGGPCFFVIFGGVFVCGLIGLVRSFRQAQRPGIEDRGLGNE
jgi:hypothetical protein